MSFRFIRSIALVAVLCIAGAAMAADKPGEIIKQIDAYRDAKLKEARTNHANLDFDALQKELKDKAIAAVKGVDPMKVDDADALDWAQLFWRAGEAMNACMIARHVVATDKDASHKFDAQTIMLNACNSLGESDNVAETLAVIQTTDVGKAIELALSTAYEYAGTIAKKDPNKAIAAIDAVASHLPAKGANDQEQGGLDEGRSALVDAKSDLLVQVGRKDDALKAVDAFIATLDPKSPILNMAKGSRSRLVLIDSPAPTLNVERGYGDFKGLDSLKGKVVILDFFAHWCPPCKAAFPEEEAMYNDLHSQGLEIVGVTSYYGFYNDQKNLAKDDEFAKMKDFIAQFKIPWGVQYGDKTNFSAYGVTGIPEVVVIDKQGHVRKIDVGYEKGSFDSIKALVEKLLKE